jgi:TPR repeat protein
MDDYLRAADGGNSTAMANIGHMYWFGEGVPVNHGKGIEWWHKAAAAGNKAAQQYLASYGE